MNVVQTAVAVTWVTQRCLYASLSLATIQGSRKGARLELRMVKLASDWFRECHLESQVFSPEQCHSF